MPHNQLINTSDSTPHDTLPVQSVPTGTYWFPNQRIATDYIHAYNSAASHQHLESDADSIHIVTAHDSLAQYLATTIYRHTPTATTTTTMPTTLRSIPYIGQQKDWIFSIIIISLILIAFIRVGAPHFITELFQSIFSENKWHKVTETIKMQNRRASIFLFANYHIAVPLFIYEFLVTQRISILNLSDIRLFLVILLVWLTLFGIRALTFRILGYVFDTAQQTTQYLQLSLIFTNITGLVLIPICLLIPFIDPAYYQITFRLGFALFILLYLWHLSKGIKIILDDLFSVFYMFLYLCALEIAPLIWLYKLSAG